MNHCVISLPVTLEIIVVIVVVVVISVVSEFVVCITRTFSTFYVSRYDSVLTNKRGERRTTS